ncbi:MAG: recombination-associated protein RdgC [Gammaproteobacteria bacterium]|nr:recombination-associated protein RdgC [Gammaproteobacteria bacterium]
MWFKNLHFYRFIKPFTLSAEQLEAELGKNCFRRCGSQELGSYGWVSPLGRGADALLHAANGYLMVAACKEEKILPGAVVNEILGERVAELEEQQMRRVHSKERAELRDQVINELLPRAFSRTQRMHAYIAPQQGYLIIDSASSKKAEELTVLLRKSLGSLPIALPESNENPVAVMTRWLTDGDCPADFTLESECELRSPEEEGGIVRCRRQNLESQEIQSHLEAGKGVIRLALSWNDRLSFVLDESLAIKRLKFLDIIQEQAAEVETDDAVVRFDADFSIMSLELSAFIDRLFAVMGGEKPLPSDG